MHQQKNVKDDIAKIIDKMAETFSVRLMRMIKERNMTCVQVYKKAYIDRRHFAKIRNDINYVPNKKTVLAFAIALELTVEQAKDLLDSAGFSLSKSLKMDIIVASFLEHKIYDMFQINETLNAYDEPIFE